MTDTGLLPHTPSIPASGSPVFYKIDSTKISLREYCWGTRSPLVLFAYATTFLRIRLPSSADDPNVESLAPFVVSDAALPADIRAQFSPLIAEVEGLGFHSPVFHAIEDTFHRTRTYLATFAHRSGEAFGRIHHRIWTYPHPPKVYLFSEFVSAFDDGKYLWSLSSKPDMVAPPTCRTEHRTGASATALWSAHLDTLNRERTSRSIVPLRTSADVVGAAERHHALVRDFHRHRGVFVPMTEAEAAQAIQLREKERSAESAGRQHPEVLAELERLEQSQTSWTSTILILLVSLVLFLGAGASDWHWETTLLLIAVLFFHETGHYVAMRIFRYRNLRMFFIPFFGAAVSGRHYNVPGWKKAVVSLMGPLPGIVLGAAIAVAGIYFRQDLLLKLASLMLILNGFNLLPILPLDGGWVAHTLLFSRHYALDVIFRLLAAAALAAASRLGDGSIFLPLAFVMLMGLPASYRQARIARDLRASGMPPTSPDDQSIPPDIAQAIIPRVKAAFPKKSTAKIVAQHTLHVFEIINAHPPGWAATVALGTVYVLGFVVAGAGAILVAMGPQTARTVTRLYLTPRASLEVAALASENTANSTTGPHSTVIATFDSGTAAQSSFHSLKPRRTEHAALRLFGQSVLVSIPAGDPAEQRWTATLQPLAGDLLVAAPGTSPPLTITCVTADDESADAIEQEASEFFTVPASFHLIPPWVAADAIDAAERARQRRARQAYLKLQSAGRGVFSDPSLRDKWVQSAAARKAGETARADALRTEADNLVKDARRRDLEQLRDESDGAIDRELLDRYIELVDTTAPKDLVTATARLLGPTMGQLPAAGDETTAGSSPRPALGGTVSRAERRVRFDTVRFADVFNDSTALIAWLSRTGCDEFHYQFYPDDDPEPDDTDDTADADDS